MRHGIRGGQEECQEGEDPLQEGKGVGVAGAGGGLEGSVSPPINGDINRTKDVNSYFGCRGNGCRETGGWVKVNHGWGGLRKEGFLMKRERGQMFKE